MRPTCRPTIFVVPFVGWQICEREQCFSWKHSKISCRLPDLVIRFCDCVRDTFRYMAFHLKRTLFIASRHQVDVVLLMLMMLLCSGDVCSTGESADKHFTDWSAYSCQRHLWRHAHLRWQTSINQSSVALWRQRTLDTRCTGLCRSVFSTRLHFASDSLFYWSSPNDGDRCQSVPVQQKTMERLVNDDRRILCLVMQYNVCSSDTGHSKQTSYCCPFLHRSRRQYL